MARIRSVKPEFWLDRKLARLLTRDERMLYMGLWNHADEHSRALGDPNVIKGAIFPYDADLTVEKLVVMLDSLDCAGVALPYEVDGDPYLFLPKLADHQRLEPGKVKSRYPAPPPDLNARPMRVTAAVDSGNFQVSEPPPDDTDLAHFFPDESEKADASPGKESLLYGTGSMEHGAWEQTCSTAPPPNVIQTAKSGDPDGFTEFWAAYPRRQGKGNALKAYVKALKKTDAAVIIAGAHRYSDDPNRDDAYTAMAATWLNGERWTDDPLPSRRGSPEPSRRVQKITDAEQYKSNPNPELLWPMGVEQRALPEGKK